MDPNNTIVVLTGATGYLAGHILHMLLTAGYQVRGTVRDKTAVHAAHLDDIEDFCPEMKESGGTLELFHADLMVPNSFDEVVDGAHYVLHTASPCLIDTSKVKNPQKDIIDPSVYGVENVLSSVEKTDSVKKVVLTSSVTAVYHSPKDKKRGEAFTEDDWNEKSTVKNNAYFASKLQEEKKAWEIKEKATKDWDMIALCAGILVGPSKHPRPSHGSFGVMTAMLSGVFRYGPNVNTPWTDVDDFARLHLLTMEHDKTIPRLLCVNATMTLMEVANVIKKKHKGYPVTKTTLPKFMYYPFMLKAWKKSKTPFLPIIPHQLENCKKGLKFDNSLLIDTFDFEFNDIEKSFQNMAEAAIAHDMVPYKRKFILF